MRETVTVKEFSSEFSGQRVGWVSVAPLAERDDLVGVNLVTATVGEQGAKEKYGLYEKPGGEVVRTYSPDDTPGFLSVAGLTALIHRETGIHSTGVDYDEAGERTLQSGARHSEHFTPLPEDKEWAVGAKDILALLEANLGKENLEEYYATLYYLFNGRALHEGLRNFRESVNRQSWGKGQGPVDISQLILADAAMQPTTQSYLEAANAALIDYRALILEDTVMKGRLTVFSDIPANAIPNSFEASRLKVAEIESRISEQARQMEHTFPVFLPTGVRRTWPYMDPAVKDPERAFGRELRELRTASTELAGHELTRELAELEYRQKYAAQGAAALRLLADAERAASS